MKKSLRIVHTFATKEPLKQAQMFSIALASMGHKNEVVKGEGWQGYRVLSEDEKEIKMVDFVGPVE